jgi:polyphosphate kinase
MSGRGAAALALALAAPAAAAHPHVFVDAGVEVRFDAAGRVAALRIVWVYDDFTSMLILSDLGLAPGPGDRLDAAALDRLRGFDMNWQPGFAGDTAMAVGAAGAALGPPEAWTADYVQGRVVTSHVRALADPADPAAAPVVIRLYDPTYYTAYTVAAVPALKGRDGCAAEVWGPDLGAASAMLEAALAELAGGDAEAEFPAVGAAFSEEIRVTCAPPS